MRDDEDIAGKLIETWVLSPAATLGSSVRAKGILQEIRARLPSAVRKSLDVNSAVLSLAMDKSAEAEFRAISDGVAKMLEGIESLPVIPREIEDILAISTSERHRWLGDGRLPSAGTRTVRLHGRAKQITFHVFDPRVVEDLLNRDLMTVWREEDAETAAENRRRAAFKAKLTRSLKKAHTSPSIPGKTADDASSKLLGWEEFGGDGLLR